MDRLDLNHSESVRDSLADSRQREISQMYNDFAQEALDRANDLNLSDSISSKMQQSQLRDLARQLVAAHNEMNDDIEDDIEDDMEETALAVVTDTRSFLERIGMDPDGAFAHLPKQVVEYILDGNLYDRLPDGSQWTLSKAIWMDNEQFQRDIFRILAEGTALNKSSFDIAKDLEKYVKGDAKKDFDWSKVYPGTRKSVDYNAQRLARTLISHAYQRSLVVTAARNPFVLGFIWHTANSHRVCPICEDMDGEFYPKNAVPLDHPSGMCYLECAIPDLVDVADRIADWANHENSGILRFVSDYEISLFANSLRKAG